jgi:23S rRNA (pseudouridine1915-N3)-methyltransferase
MAGLHIDLVAVGKPKEAYWVAACAEYHKRLGRYARLRLAEVAESPVRTPTPHTIASALRLEAERLRGRLPAQARRVLLDSAGTQLSSEGMAALLAEAQGSGGVGLAFVVGGPWGIDEDFKGEADLLLSLGLITLPHDLARVVLLEQLYRAFRIINGEPYHH